MDWPNVLIIAVACLTCITAAAQNLTMDDLLTSSGPVNTDAPPGALVVNGQPAATIVMSVEPSDEILFAAKQLQTYLEQMSGAVLPAVTEDNEVSGNRILLGVADMAAEAGVTVPEGLDEEGYLISSAGRDLAIIGGSDWGTLYGVCGLLEDHLSIRWYVAGDPLGECVPKMHDIVLENVHDQQSPSFPMRWIGRSLPTQDSDWGVMNRQNCAGKVLQPGFKIDPGIYHTQDELLPYHKYFNEHPEYFALVEGERSKDRHCKLCYANPEVAREVARRMAERLEADPDIALISFSPTDGQLWCECDACRAMDEEDVPDDQSKSRRSVLFYNAIGAELRKTHPEAKILVGAYNVYAWPPKDRTIKADPMLGVIICHYDDYCMAHPVADPDCPPNQRYLELIEAWESLGCDVYFYEYYWKLHWLDLPWPIVHSIKEDMPWYCQRGHKGVYTQFHDSNAWTLLPAYYVAAKLMWNVNADVDAIFDEMCNRLFGKASPAIREYYRATEESMANCGAHMPGHGTTRGLCVFTDEVLATMRRALGRAHELADDELVQRRLAKFDLSFDYIQRLMRYANLRASTYAEEDPQKAVPIGEEALRVADDLVADFQNNYEKWRGVLSTTMPVETYLFRQIGWLRDHVAKLRAEATQQK